MVLLFPSISMAQLSQTRIQKEMVIARYHVDQAYGVAVARKIDDIFRPKILSKDMELFESLN